MDEPIWVQVEAVSAIHQRLLSEHGGLAGVREPGGLDAAMARPQQLLAYGDPPPDLAAMASVYAGGFVRNHPFVDGNKRVALAIAVTFLRLNGWNLIVTQLEAQTATIQLATRAMTEEEFASWLRAHLAPWEPTR